jgi:hypothetical protein
MPKAPNILLFLVDELRYPTVYDGPELRAWMAENLVAQRLLRERGIEFHGFGLHDASLTTRPP